MRDMSVWNDRNAPKPVRVYCGKCEKGWRFRPDPDPNPIYNGLTLAYPCPDCNSSQQAMLNEYREQLIKQGTLDRTYYHSRIQDDPHFTPNPQLALDAGEVFDIEQQQPSHAEDEP